MAKDYIKIDSPMDLNYYKGNIVASYQYNHKTFRYNLLRIDKSLFLPSVKGLKFNETFTQKECEDAVAVMNELLPLLHKALNAISKTLNKDDSIKKAVVDRKINEYRNEVITPDGLISDFTSWIEEFKEEKKQQEIQAGMEVREFHPTLKDYISTRNLLLDYEHDEFEKPIQFQDIDSAFITDLIEYCYDERPKESDEDPPYKYRTQGDLSNKTINKRIDCLFTFFRSKYEKLPKGYKKAPHLDVCERKVIRLNRDELRILENLEIEEERLLLARDYFVFLCYTGLRYSDFSKLDDTYYDKETNQIIIKATKTHSKCEIFLFDKAKEIAEKYDFSFKHFTNQALNRTLQDLFEKYDLFGEDVTMEYMQKGRQTYTKKKRELLSCHAGRRTYISIMVELGLGLYEIMSTTGHKKVDTLKFYIDKFGPDRRNKFESINEKLK